MTIDEETGTNPMEVSMSTPDRDPQGESPHGPASPTSKWRDAAGYLGVVLVTLTSLVVSQQGWQANPRVPLFDSYDALFSQMLVKNVIETGWYDEAPRLGAPGQQNLLDFANADALHIGIIRLLACFSRNHAVVLNLFTLSLFPLIGLSSYFVLRRLGLGRAESVVAGALYACTPYHLVRICAHLFLCAYFLLPLMIWVAVRLYLGWDPLRAARVDGGPRPGLRSWDTFGAVLVCVLTGVAGIYYAFFSCFLLLAVGVRVAFRERRWGGLLTPALLVLCVTASVAAGLYPAVVHRFQAGKNPKVANRLTVQAEVYGLKPSEMLMPAYKHRLARMREFRDEWFSPHRPTTGSKDVVPLGVLASAGFLYLVGRFLLWRPAGEQATDGLAYLNVVALALASVGGVGAFFAHFVSPAIRCYDRMSILISFFSIAALFLALGSAGRAARGWGRAAYLAALGGLLVAGIYDQTPHRDRATYSAIVQTHDSDRDFGRRMEAALRPGAMVYQMPYIAFPEADQVHKLHSYEQFRPYFHTRTLRWSHGAVEGRESGVWLEGVSKLPLPEALESLALAGFEGVHLDRRGFADGGAAAEAEIGRLLGVAPLVSRNGLQAFFDMTRYTRGTHDRLGDREWERRRAALSVPAPALRP